MDGPVQEIESRMGRAWEQLDELCGVVEEIHPETAEEWNRMACRLADLVAELQTVVLVCGYAARAAIATA